MSPIQERPPALVFCERLDNESFCASVVRELGAWYDVRPCGPGWAAADLDQVDTRGARFYLEMDAASGSFVRPSGLARLALPKAAWLIDTHKKPGFHRELSAEMDLTFHAMATWGHVLAGRTAWLPVHCDQELFRPQEAEREWDVVFVGSQSWRADPLRRIAERHGLRLLVTCTTGPREKSETASIYARTKVVFNRHVTNDLNFRLVEGMACGRAVLTDAQPNGQYELFEDERHYLLYKDERDLERQLLRLLGDEGLRARIEREAAEHAHARHTTRVRVAELRAALEQLVSERAAALRPAAIEVRWASGEGATTSESGDTAEPELDEQGEADSRPAGPPARWLVLDGPRPPTIEQRSLAELYARSLARAGDGVLLVRWGSTPPLLPPRAADGGEPRTAWIDPGPLPLRGRAELEVEPSAALLARVVELAEAQGPFQGLLVEGALGALVGPFVSEQLGLPLVLALPGCEVERRQNRLTREQLYQAELEQWGCERAARVLAPSAAVARALSSHYGAARVRVCPPAREPTPAPADALLERLGIAARLALILAPELSAADAERLLDPPGLELEPGQDVVLVGRETWLRRAAGGLELLARSPTSGPALAALFAAAGAVLCQQSIDPRQDEARALGIPVLTLPPGDLTLPPALDMARRARSLPGSGEIPDDQDQRDRRVRAACSGALQPRPEVSHALR